MVSGERKEFFTEKKRKTLSNPLEGQRERRETREKQERERERNKRRETRERREKREPVAI